MRDCQFWNPTKIIFGKSALEKLRENIAEYGDKILLTYGQRSIKRNGIYQRVKKQLKGFKVNEFGGIEPNPRVETVRKALVKFKKDKPEFILACGGGSVIDASKLLAASFYYSGDPWDFLVKNVEPRKYVPLGTVLTMAATGSEMNRGAVITNWERHEKLSFSKDENYPKFSILNPEHTFSVPRQQTAYGIVDAFSHVLEQYLHTEKDTPLQDRFSEGILLTLIENAPIVLRKPNDYQMRAKIMLCATMALNKVISVGTGQDWACHEIEHELSAFYDIPHGAGLAIITPRWMEVIKGEKRDKLAQYGRRIWALKGKRTQIVDQTIRRTSAFFKSLGLKMTLKDWGIDAKNFEKMTAKLVKRGIGETRLSKSQITKILVNSLEK